MDQISYSNSEIPVVMDVPTLGNLLGVGRNTAYTLIRSGQIQFIRIGKQIRIPRHAVLQYLGANIPQ